MFDDVPQPLIDACRPALSDLPMHRQQLFLARLRRWWPDLVGGLAAVYPEPDAVAARAVALAARGFAERDEDLHLLDLRRSLEPDWFQRPGMVGYAAYTERFGGTLAGVGAHSAYLRDLGVSYVHLMPLLGPRPAPNDGGYAVANYRAVQEDLGTVEDLRALAARLRGEGMSLCLDLVLNHVAYEHAWAAAARDGDPHYRDYFYTYRDRTEPDRYDATIPDVFPDFAPGNFTFDDGLDAWVWTTFNSYQWDVAWSNPDVFCEYADIIVWLSNQGVEILRLDAIAFIWKRLGTTCQNQSEVHSITRALRALTRIACPATIFKGEAIVGPRDLVQYLGTGEYHGKVSDLAYHNSLMVQIWSMLASRDVRLATQALQGLPPIPSTTAWITYARCHDDIGWAIDDADAAAVGLSGFGHRAFLSDFYSGEFPGSFARGLVFQENEATKDRRISGSLASLAGLTAAEDAGDPGAVATAIDRILLVHAVILGWGGLPVIWMGDELALGNDPDWASDPSHADDNRWAHRPPMPWRLAAEASQPESMSVSARVYHGVRDLIATRALVEELHASVGAEVLDPSDLGVLLVLRRHPLGPMLGLYNVTDSWRPVPVQRLYDVGLDPATSVDRLTETALTLGGDGQLWLSPYAALWLTDP